MQSDVIKVRPVASELFYVFLCYDDTKYIKLYGLT